MTQHSWPQTMVGGAGEPVEFSAAQAELVDFYDRATPPQERRQERDHRPLEDVLQDAGKYVVGTPGASALAPWALMAKRMAEEGLLERVKTDGPIEYRLTQLGERVARQRSEDRLRAEVRRIEAERHDEAKRRRLAEEQLARRNARIEELLGRSWWRRLFNRGR